MADQARAPLIFSPHTKKDVRQFDFPNTTIRQVKPPPIRPIVSPSLPTRVHVLRDTSQSSPLTLIKPPVVQAPFKPVDTSFVQAKKDYPPYFPGRSMGAGAPAVIAAPFFPIPDVFIQRKANVHSLDWPNLPLSSLDFQPIATAQSEWPELPVKLSYNLDTSSSSPFTLLLGVAGPITGTLNKTNNNDTATASGVNIITGSLNKTNSGDISSGTGVNIITGSSATTNNNDVSTAVGWSGSAPTVTSRLPLTGMGT